MDANTNKKITARAVWPGRKTTLRRLLTIALVLFPCTWIVNAILIGSWNLLGDRNAESIRHLMEAGFIFVSTVCLVFLLSLLARFQGLVAWLSSWRVIRRTLIVFAWLVTIIALFYGEEDWRGHHAWNQYADSLAAKGEELDFKAFIPKPVPDADNFAATPEVQSWFIRYTNATGSAFSNSMLGDVFASASTRVSSDSSRDPRRLMDLVAWQTAFDAVRAGAPNSTQIFQSETLDAESRAKAAPAVLQALKPLQPRLEELRAAGMRPQSRYPVIYDLNNPWGILLPHLANVKAVCLRLDLRACAELAAGQPDRALDDVTLTLRMSDSLNAEPFLISYLVRLATFHIATHSVWEGLADHRWSDAQLKELQALLERYNFIAEMNPSLASERAGGILTANLLANGTVNLNELTGDPNPLNGSAANAFGKMMPHGWYEMEKLNYCRLFNLQLEGDADAANKRVFPGKVESNVKALDQALVRGNVLSGIFTRHQLLSAVLLPALGKISLKSAAAQTADDQAALACALERFRLAHGQFPENLDALTPDFVSRQPHDVITGEPYKYRRTADSFVLYSVGWNETDDGGQVPVKASSIMSTNGDWVWQYPAK